MLNFEGCGDGGVGTPQTLNPNHQSPIPHSRPNPKPQIQETLTHETLNFNSGRFGGAEGGGSQSKSASKICVS